MRQITIPGIVNIDNQDFEVNIQLNVKDLPKGEFISTWALQNENKENLGEPIPISIKKK